MVWTNRKDTYPYVSRETWRTRSWLLIKKVQRYNEASANDRRVAAMLLADTKHPQTDHECRMRLEKIAYGSNSVKASPDDGSPPHEDLGA